MLSWFTYIYLLKKFGFIILMQKLLELMQREFELALDEIHVMRGSLNLKKWTSYMRPAWTINGFLLHSYYWHWQYTSIWFQVALGGCGKFPKFHRMTFKSAFSECNMKPKMHSSQFRQGGCVSLYYSVVWHTDTVC